MQVKPPQQCIHKIFAYDKMTQPLPLKDRNPAYFPAGMRYVYGGKLYPRQPTLPDIATREVLGTDVGSSLGRRMIARAVRGNEQDYSR